MRRVICYLGLFLGLVFIIAFQSAWASDVSEVLFTKGLMYYDLGRYDLAVQNLREAAREDPANLEIRRYLAMAESKFQGEPSPVSFYEKAVQKAPSSFRTHLNLAVVLYLHNQWDRAAQSIERAAHLAPDNGEVLFFRGLIRLKQGACKGAVDDLKKARGLEPRLEQGSLYYEAMARLKLRERRSALLLFREVIGKNPMSAYASEAAVMVRSAEVKRLSAKLTVGVEYDTNATLEGNRNTLGVPLDLPDKEQIRFPVSALLDYRFWDVGEWSFGGRYGLYTSFHEESNDMNVISNTGELYGVWKHGRWSVRPFYYYRSVFLDNDHYSDTHSIGSSVIYYSPWMNLAPELFVRWRHREYHFPTTGASDPDEMNLRGEFNQYMLLQGGRGYLRAGVGLEGNRTDGENIDYRALLALAGFQYQLPWSMVFQFDFEYQDRQYDHIHSIFNKKRRDHRYAFSWQVGKALWGGFEVRGRVAHIRNDSNVGEFDYDRQVYSLLFSWNY